MKSNNQTVYIITIIAAVTGLLFGYDTGVISGAILFINHHFELTAWQTGVVVSSVLLGACFGALLSSRLADRYGRRRILIFTSLIFILGSLGSAMSHTTLQLSLSRVILGVAIGTGSYTAPLYISEIAPYEIRGALVSFNQLAITLGILTSYLIDYYYAATANWRMMLAIGAVPGVMLLLGMFFLPNSPRWLCLIKQRKQAEDILRKIRGEYNVENEIAAIHEHLQHDRSNWTIIFSKRVRPVLIVGIGIALTQQLTGINTIIYFAPSILQMAGFHSSTNAIMATMGVGVINVLATLIALPLIDRIGRKPLLYFGLVGMFMSLALLGFAFQTHAATPTLKWTALVSMLSFIACYAISLGPVPFVIISEIFPLDIRGFGMGVTLACNWIANLSVSLTFLSLIEMLGPFDTFYLFSFICLLALVFVYCCVPETKNCSLERICANLYAGRPTRELGLCARPIEEHSNT